MKLTRDQAIAEFRKMWNWIADETERRNAIVEKSDYFKNNGIEEIECDCYLCEYDEQNKGECKSCPIDFNVEGDEDTLCGGDCSEREGSPYSMWMNWKSWCVANKKNKYFDGYGTLAKYAREIANLPEKEE